MQPVAVNVLAASMAFKTYTGGILTASACRTGTISYSTLEPFGNILGVTDHALVVVGYDVSDADRPYWIAKNSWGA